MRNKILKYTLFGFMFLFIGAFGVFVGILIAVNKPFFSAISPYSIRGIPGTYVVISGSMEPLIKTGGLVLSVPVSNYSIGDVVTFNEGDKSKTLVTHRIAAKIYSTEFKQFVYYTKGDANKTIDDKVVVGNQILGKTVLGIPYLGYVANSVKDPKMFILFVIVPATIIIYEELKYLKAEASKLLAKLSAKFKSRFSFNDSREKNSKGINKTLIIVPMLGILILLSKVSGSFFTDTKTSSGNVLSAAEQFSSPTPSVSPRPTIIPEPTATPTQSNQKEALLYNSDPYTCADGASDLSQNQLTSVIINNDGVNVSVTVQLTGASPSSLYDIWINQDPGGCPLSSPTNAGGLSTDPSGSGTGVASATLVSGATKFWVSVVGGGQVLRSSAESF